VFDPVTSALIQGAPRLDGLDVDSLPQRLTRAHAWIATLRLRLASGQSPPTSSAQFDELRRSGTTGTRPSSATGQMAEFASDLQTLRLLANTYEAYAVALPNAEDRASAAYVAAAAHQLLFSAATLGLAREKPRAQLTASSVSSDISALLLYLIAGYPSDAVEMASVVDPHDAISRVEQRSVTAILVSALADLSRGRLRRIVRIRLAKRRSGATRASRQNASRDDEGVVDAFSEDYDRAVDGLWRQIAEAIRRLARALLGAGESTGQRDYRSILTTVIELSVSQLSLPAYEGRSGGLQGAFASAFDSFAGPHHLARLLLAAGDRLSSEAVVAIPTPPGADPSGWSEYLRALSLERPYLWANHLDAIRAGYLAKSTSAVVTFPTGAGKSTLSELKIAATLQADRRVVFLAPTRALVWQVYQNLKAAFPDSTVAEALVGEGAYHEAEAAEQPAVVVMTPERCLMYLGSAEQALSNVGLLVFDECHLLNPQSADGSDRRSLDAMLCLLGMLDVAPDADILLLSAMVSNATELAEWIASATGRRCLSLTLAWKPTRQVRGCVVYDRSDVKTLSKRAVAKRRLGQTRNPPQDLRRDTQATPLALFGLTHAWNLKLSPEVYTLLPLLDERIPLALNNSWTVTANKNEVAARLAARMAARGIKVIVFLQNKDHCASVASTIAKALTRDMGNPLPPLQFTSSETDWLASATEEMGSATCVIVPATSAAAVHHSLLLPSERRVSESLFSRVDGVQSLVATPTVAQGMNLPAEAVIIAGDGRFDQQAGMRAQLTAHELLNAAGRAGRAGFRASGVVLVVPDKLVTTDSGFTDVDPPWESLNADVFSKADQCLVVNDPVALLLDKIEVGASESWRNPFVRYFVTRLPIDENDADPAAAASRILGRSLAAYRAKQRGRTAWFQAQLNGALEARKSISGLAERIVWLDRIVSTSGMPAQRVKQLDTALRRRALPATATVVDWVDWLFRWFTADGSRFTDMISPPARRAAMTPDEQRSVEANGAWTEGLRSTRSRLRMWMGGVPLIDLEDSLRTADGDSAGVSGGHNRGICKSARIFANRFVLDISYVSGLVTQIYRAQLEHGDAARPSDDSDPTMPISLAVLGACVREGVDSPEKLALYSDRDPYASRVGCHRQFASIAGLIEPGSLYESFADTHERVAEALRRAEER
jgi:superfamily II DNA/RNA helicase